MALPESLRATPLGLKSGRPAAGPRSGVLSFHMQTQEQNNWCWAAVGSSVGHFFGVPDLPQCQIVLKCWPELEPGRPIPDCCDDPSACNVQGMLNQSLAVTGTYAGWTSGKSTIAEVEQELEQGRPLCLRIQFVGKGGHFLAITGGCARSGRVLVKDPLFGDSLQVFSGFPDSYQGQGAEWTGTYRTTAPPCGGKP